MEELARIKKNSPVVQISAYLKKIYKKICDDREKKVPEHQIKEIESLKGYLKSENIQLSLMTCQTFVKLVENGILELNNMMTLFISVLPSCSTVQYTAVSEGVVSLMLIVLKRKINGKKVENKFQSPYSIKSPEHPLIALIRNDGTNMNEIVNKMCLICNHHDRDIKDNSIEFLRPVYLYVLCNPQTVPDSKMLWSHLIVQSQRSTDASDLCEEVLCWSKLNSPASSLFTCTLLMEAIDRYLAAKNYDKCITTVISFAFLTGQMIKFGHDPRMPLQCLLRALVQTREVTRNTYNVILIIFAEVLHIITPFYLPELLRVLHFIIVSENSGSQCSLNMILDGTITWLSQIHVIAAEGVFSAHKIIENITKLPLNERKVVETNKLPSSTRYFHSDVALAVDLAILSESFDKDEYKGVYVFVDTLNTRSQSSFCKRINLFLRALFLLKDLPIDCWFKIHETILKIVKTHENMALDFIMTFLYKLARETNPEAQLELLKGLPNFAVAKDNIPIILNTLRIVCSDQHTALNIDLHLRLWKEEDRTYPFLYKLISKNLNATNPWEYDIAKASAIREICETSPSKYISELVPHLNEILNRCDDLATSIALDAIVLLCGGNLLNITSTWQELCRKFRKENRSRTLKSLYQFFAHVPLLPSPTEGYRMLLEEALGILWQIVSRSENTKAINLALKALENFDPETIMTFDQVPYEFRPGMVPIEDYSSTFDEEGGSSLELAGRIPCGFWIRFLHVVNPKCIENASDLISHYIKLELERMKSWEKFRHTRNSTVLESVMNYLIVQSRNGHIGNPLVVTHSLRSIARKFTKPIPPSNFSFLHSFFNLNLEARKYCIQIAINQMQTSETAARILDSFLLEFEPNCFTEDLQFLFSVFPELASMAPIHALKVFVEKIVTYCFTESQISGFAEGCLFEKFLDSVKYVFLSKCEVPESLDIFTTIVERYMDAMDLDSRLFEKYTEVVATLHTTAIDRLTSPSAWWEVPIGKLKKATIIRCYLVLYNHELENPLTWLGPIIDSFAERVSEQPFFFRHFVCTLYAFEDENSASSWVLDMTRQIQTLLVDPSNAQKQEKFLFLLDIFVLSVITFSGCALLLGSLETAATQKVARMEIFPESLQVLCDQVFWREIESKLYEFLHYLYKHQLTPSIYCEMFRNAIVCSRNRPYCDNKGVWTKFLGLRK